jgi:hypothetical protein
MAGGRRGSSGAWRDQTLEVSSGTAWKASATRP